MLKTHIESQPKRYYGKKFLALAFTLFALATATTVLSMAGAQSNLETGTAANNAAHGDHGYRP